ncbi:electron transfer flavoprotein subunit alpha/FixB family protein [Clostridium botulinum]|uniref:Electron transfer flavoprotein subunit alpha n=1 Tax=Clostridium botulinum C/D str. DC5 TaxID=1443128 RepID=A0A0A0IAK6_CLOBO|nr:electron transfer flavoprotein subunit alpha/FixB family protein [Clostridium botulinum]KGM98489.1 electron transfer flavoprotein subunit alpha [Clostridium botulinum C/D str. DC5]KOC51850.1 electron transfer flavoprotein subunit alpha [Clostridium botulinum]KOC53590.1 electron transfer flavoprotein subunit alpha [Clostridium botulinum]MCD3234857.1 electron transfer flavoprotein subunit alpha/FixB family protein [Clostridium botulinum D/C]MCD3240756.1 electron transfer flavoprotein subunit 
MKLKSIFVISEEICIIPALASAAKELANKVTAVVFGDEEYVKSTSIPGVDAVIYCPLNGKFSPEDYSEILAEEIKKDDRAYLLIGNTVIGRSLAGRIGVSLESPVFSNVENLSVEDNSLVFSQTVYGGTASRKLKYTSAYGIVTINDGAFEVNESLENCDKFAQIEKEPKNSLKLIDVDVKNEVSVNLAVAKKIVDIGRSVSTSEDVKLFEQLASIIGAELGCSRPVAENNKLLPKSQYMGITGVQVKPDLIITIGLSGQIQHIGGINKSKVIVSINKDKQAPIFENCDFGLIGDMYKIVPKLIEKLS